MRLPGHSRHRMSLTRASVILWQSLAEEVRVQLRKCDMWSLGFDETSNLHQGDVYALACRYVNSTGVLVHKLLALMRLPEVPLGVEFEPETIEEACPENKTNEKRTTNQTN